MLIVFPPIFVADTKIIYGYNFAAPLTVTKKQCFALYLEDTFFEKPKDGAGRN